MTRYSEQPILTSISGATYQKTRAILEATEFKAHSSASSSLGEFAPKVTNASTCIDYRAYTTISTPTLIVLVEINTTNIEESTKLIWLVFPY